MITRLNFVNRSLGNDAPEVLIFQRNVVPSMSEMAIAWKVIRYCGFDCHHPFTFSTDLTIGISDDYGNHSRGIAAAPGQILAVTPFGPGRKLAATGRTTGTAEIEVHNDLPRGAITVNVFKDGRLLARKTGVAPEQEVVLQYRPTLWIGAVSQVVEGSALDSAVIDSINTEFSLIGMLSADIVMNGGGSGPDSAPYVFTMENIVMA